MNVTSQHVTGFFIGVGAAAVGYYFYKNNQAKVDDFLRRQGIQIPERTMRDPAALSLEELVSEKERLEDIIAEREMAEKEAKPTAKK
jgi:predicted transcriptional regulator